MILFDRSVVEGSCFKENSRLSKGSAHAPMMAWETLRETVLMVPDWRTVVLPATVDLKVQLGLVEMFSLGPIVRDAPHLFGLGIQEMLADEMTTELRTIRDQAVSEAKNGSQERVLIDADFEDGTDSFVFVDDPFGTSNAEYSRGRLAQLQGESRRVVTILGGRDRERINGMSGGWEATFTLDSGADVRIEFTYRLDQSASYESDEISQAILSIGGEETILAEFVGDGNGGSHQNTGIQSFSVEVNLDAGTHSLVLGAFNNKKTARNERTSASFDDVRVTELGGGTGPVTKNLVAKNVNFGKITRFSGWSH